MQVTCFLFSQRGQYIKEETTRKFFNATKIVLDLHKICRLPEKFTDFKQIYQIASKTYRLPAKSTGCQQNSETHWPVSDDHHLVSLYDLLEEDGRRLHDVLLARLAGGGQEQLVVCLGEGHAGEEIWGDSPEERHVVWKELWKIDVLDGAEKLGEGWIPFARQRFQT